MKDNFVRGKISIIIPVYNGAKYVPTILESLKVQILQNFEVVFVNDGSNDDSAEVLDQLTSRDLPFTCTVIHQQNAGVSAARNQGMEQAQGEYICFVDVDDIISVDYLDVMYHTLTATNTRVVVAHITRNQEDLHHHIAPEILCHSSTEFLREFLYRGIKYSVCACMFHRDCFQNPQHKFPKGYRYSEDVFLLWQLFASEETIAEVKCKVYFYYDNPYSAMNNGIDVRRKDAIVLMQKLEGILAELNPEFSKEFNQYAVARHHWSILWQAATKLGSYREFREYCTNFAMKPELKKLLSYPELRISLSSLVYVISPGMYYFLLRMYVIIRNKKH